jgi:hypothetical protein
MYTSTAILLDLARLFLKPMVTMHVLGNVVVSVPLPIVELLKFGACRHLVSLLLNVVLDDLEDVIPIVDEKHGHSVLSVLGVLHDLELLGNLHVHIVIGVNLGDFVLDTSFTFSLPGVHD